MEGFSALLAIYVVKPLETWLHQAEDSNPEP